MIVAMLGWLVHVSTPFGRETIIDQWFIVQLTRVLNACWSLCRKKIAAEPLCQHSSKISKGRMTDGWQ